MRLLKHFQAISPPCCNLVAQPVGFSTLKGVKAMLKSALSIAINSDMRKGDLATPAAAFRQLRTALGRAERGERG